MQSKVFFISFLAYSWDCRKVYMNYCVPTLEDTNLSEKSDVMDPDPWVQKWTQIMVNIV